MIEIMDLGEEEERIDDAKSLILTLKDLNEMNKLQNCQNQDDQNFEYDYDLICDVRL